MYIHLFKVTLWSITLGLGFSYQAHAQTTFATPNTKIITSHAANQFLDAPLLAQKQGKVKNKKRTAQNLLQTQETEIPQENYQRRGVVIAENRVRISSQIDATISKLHIAEGAQFEENDLLIEFDCSIERAALEEARLSHEVAKFDYEAKKGEAEEISVSPQTLELLKLKTELALTKLNHLRERIQHCRLLAPFAGRVLKILVQEYETVNALAPVMEIVDNQPLHFRVFLPWAWLKWLSVGDIVEIEVIDKNYPAELVELSKEVDPLDQSIKAVLKFQSQDELIIGMNGIAKFKR